MFSWLIGASEFMVYLLLTSYLGNGDGDDSTVKFYYSRPNGPFMTEVSRTTAPTIDQGQITYFIVHGFRETYDHTIYVNITENLLQKGFVVMSVDWSLLAGTLNYFTATRNVEKVAKVIATYILANNINPTKIRMVGMSLGAHVCGFVGKELKRKKATLNSIMGLDPAGPLYGLFAPVPDEFRLDKKDASFVVTLQTNGGHYGTMFPLGNVNFRANDGTHQPGCHDPDTYCCHERAITYYYYSLLSNKFIGIDDKNNTLCFGFHIPVNASGMYTFYTGSEPPFST